MSGIYRYSILKDHNLIIMVLQKDLDIDRLKKMRLEISEDKDFNPECKLLVDVRLSKLNVSVKEIKKFGRWFFQNSKMNAKNKKTFLTCSPDQVVKSLVFTTISYLSSFNISSTLEACLKHLEIDISDIDIIEKEIEMMI